MNMSPFLKKLLPHLLALAIFYIVTIFFFSPLFFDNKALIQHDIDQFKGGAQSIIEYRKTHKEEALWAENMFSGMPAYLISVQWDNQPVSFIKRIFSMGMPTPASNTFWAFLSFYILLLAFRVRPMLAIAGALAFGLSTYMIIGLTAGHNARIGAIAFMPLVMAGIHLAYSNQRWLGFGLTAIALSQELRENHLQITYYLFIIVLFYGLVQLISFIREKKVVPFVQTTAMLLVAALLAVGTFFGQLWGVNEYSAYTIRGKSDLVSKGTESQKGGLTKEYAFDASNGILEPMMMMIPNFYGGSARNFLVQDENSNAYKALVSSNDQQMANQLAQYTSAYWGPQSYTVPYYAGAIIVFLFVLGIAFAEKKYVWWLVTVAAIGIMLSWGSSFKTVNYFLFDYLPGLNKFRSVTFALIITLFALPLLGMLGLERFLEKGVTPKTKKKLYWVLGSTAGLCLLLIIGAGMFSFMREGESQLPTWFSKALVADRKSLFRSDAFRSMAFIVSAFIMLFFSLWKKTPVAFYTFFIFMIAVDLIVVNKRYLTKENYQSKRENAYLAMNEADQEILKDKGYYRVYNIQPGAFTSEARTSYFHRSLGGYHGAKLRRYQDVYDSCLFDETNKMITDAQSGNLDFNKYSVMNMLNAKYIVYGPQRDNIIPNNAANGAAWFVKDVMTVNTANEELLALRTINTRNTAVINGTKAKVEGIAYDSAATITLLEHSPRHLKYESNTTVKGLAVFSEIYYDKGWKAFIDGQETPIIQADYILRALQVPEGKHTLEFKFEPKAYMVGNKVTLASSWLTIFVLLGSIGLTIRKETDKKQSQ